jgi:hypothetical protein
VHAQQLLLNVHFDINCQPCIEDTHAEFFALLTRWFQRFQQFLAWDPPKLRINASFSPLATNLHAHPFLAQRILAFVATSDQNGHSQNSTSQDPPRFFSDRSF